MRKAIGTHAEAKIAYRLGQTKERTYLPDGWQFCGAGISRYAYLSPTGVVYKVNISTWGDAHSNENEIDNLLRVATTPVPGWTVPTFASFRVNGHCVVAMEYLGDIEVHLGYNESRQMARAWKCLDAHGGNVRRKGDSLALIDFGGKSC